MSYSHLSRIKREHGFKVDSKAGKSTYVMMSKIRRAVLNMTDEDFGKIKAGGLGRNTTKDVLVNMMMTRAERMSHRMIEYILEQLETEGMVRMIGVIRMNFGKIKELAHEEDPESKVIQDHIQAY